jgi:hypothetical protein
MNQKLLVSRKDRSGERGGARLKFMIVALVLGAMAYGGYLFVPVWYQFWVIKDRMKTEVNLAATMGLPPSSVVDKLKASAVETNLPPDAVITIAQVDNCLAVKVEFTHNVELPGYTYPYKFDETVKSTPFIGNAK